MVEIVLSTYNIMSRRGLFAIITEQNVLVTAFLTASSVTMNDLEK